MTAPRYKVVTVPALSHLRALASSLPIAGAAVGGLVAEAGLIAWSRRHALPSWVAPGLDPVLPWSISSAEPAASKSESHS
jgi:hypothetical protein